MSEPTIVFVFELKHWYNSISPLSKIDLLDIVPHVSVQFGFDGQNSSYLLVITKSKWQNLQPEIKKKFMMISRRIKEEMEGPLTSAQREQYENSDPFVAFEKSAAEKAAAEQPLAPVPEENEITAP